MREDRLSFGKGDANMLTLKVENVKITPTGTVTNGSFRSGFLIEMVGYNIDNVLVQLLEDYGESEIIKRIQSL